MTYIIGEIGQNHNGSIGIVKSLIDLVSIDIIDDAFGVGLKGIDAVKLTKRDLEHELTKEAMNRPYDSPHSFGKTYGEHRAALELSDEEHYEAYCYAKSKGLDFVETLCAIGCLSILKLFTPDKLKVASRDLTNIPLLEALAETKIPIILSTGMSGEEELEHAVNTITKHHSELSILHCVSEYPTRPENVNLLTILWLKERYPDFQIGFSDHTIGIAAPVAAVALGAEIIEKHITLDRRLKGTDQKGSLGPDGMRRMIRDVRLIEQSLGTKEIRIEDSVLTAKTKLERSLATREDLPKGHVLREEDLHMLSPGDGYRWNELPKVLGKTLQHNLTKDSLILPEHIQ